ncbi:MAG: MerR family transcriptional regulator [Xanthobacteraceae bacterium]
MEKAPDAFRTISEVAGELDVPQHVLRFWETRFAQIKPMKRGGGRRYYRPDDVDLLRGIRHLLYGEGYTIRGVQRILREQGPKFVQAVWQADAEQPQRDPEDDDEEAVPNGRAAEPEAATRKGGERPRRLFDLLPSLFESEARASLPGGVALDEEEPDLQPEPSEAASGGSAQVTARREEARPEAPVRRSSPAPENVDERRTAEMASSSKRRGAVGIADEDRRKLDAALHELAECRRLLDAALEDEDSPAEDDAAEDDPAEDDAVEDDAADDDPD